ncbi:MAG TPA: hybrid sensor histidine kinase/response regulator [Candidatus Bacteroides pullicola]|uniref:histidine kinase n=1 Tax=Candidatus Bacteroides pullicola TaxID=2838475 RepID=A0A9D2CKI7_9BACE|nr:hybrid sensor histidine kinase/response regulator [Candidatus Bacteroides pullicola]
MNNVSRFKVIVSYAALLAVLFFSLYFVHREMGVLMQTDGHDEQWVDSLSALLQEKDENTVRILRTLTEVNDSLISTTEIEDILTNPDTMPMQPRVQRRLVHHRDTVVTPPSPRQKKGFFKRLREAFSPPEPDSSIQVKSSVEYIVDTLEEAYNPVDSLQARLREVVRREREVNTVISHRKQRLQAVNARLTVRIDSLLKQYEEETLQQVRADAKRRMELRHSSARTVGAIAVGAVLLAALFALLIGRDIARNNRYRRELEEARRKAEDLLAVREQLMLAITHDFKAPLGSIIGYADLLARLTVDGRQRFYLDNMKQSSQHLLRLVTDLLDFHRLDLHKVEVHRVPFHPARLLEEICTSFRPLTSDKGLALHCRLAAELSAAYVCDPQRLRQIVNNLLSNAVKFTERGDVTLSATYGDGHLVVSVADTGCGMKPEDRERIFQEFTRLPDAQGQEGFGLGLSIVRMLVQLLGGTIAVESEPGKGSVFTVRIPMPRTQEAAVEESAPVSEDLPVPGACRLLLIDDDRIQLTLTSAMLKQQGILSVSCLQVDELLDALRSGGHFDALLTDVQMPAMNGFELLHLLRASNIPLAKDIPVIAVTARSDLRQEDFVAHGFAGCLHKPFTMRELREVLARVGDIPSILPPAETMDAPAVAKGGLDFSALTAFSGDDEEAARSIVESFVAETRQNLLRLREALGQADVDTLAAVAHKMIPLFTLIGAGQTVDRLRQLEAAKGSPWEEDLAKVAEQVQGEVEEILKEAEQTNKDSL